MKTSADLYIIHVLLASIETEPSDGLRRFTQQLHAIEARLSAGDESASTDFWDLVRNGAFGEDLILSLSDHTIAFVSQELSRLNSIKAQRALTDEEKCYSRDVLFRLLESLKPFFAPGNAGPNED